jgi:carboxymethylenebutenolidase
MPESTTVTFESSRGEAEGYLARPDAPGEGGGRPAVVVIQEWWGLVPHIEDVSRRLAEEGYIALAPDLYHGKTTVDDEEAHHLMEGLDWGRAAAELAGAVHHLREAEGATSVGVVGYCMGGALTMVAAAGGGVDAYASFYGFPPEGAADVEGTEAPGILFYGDQEDVFSVPDAQAFAERQRERGRETETVVYPDAGHAFFNDTRETYREHAARDAWARTLELFRRHLS